MILTAAQRDGAASSAVKRYRRAGFDLVISILPKRSIDDRNQFIAALPGLMAALNEGMALIEWPEASRNAFFGHLIADHSGSLKSAPQSDLDRNLLVKQLEIVFRTPIPDAAAAASAPIANPALFEQRFTPEQALQVGLLGDAAVDWSEQVDIPLDLDTSAPPSPGAPSDRLGQAPAEVAATGPSAGPGSLSAPMEFDETPQAASADEPEVPAEGPTLRDYLQVGFSYQLLLDGVWEKLRLTYMSPGRNFFLFTHGAKDRRSISMTVRMVDKLCAAHRMKALESSTLIERATQRARSQLVALNRASQLEAPYVA